MLTALVGLAVMRLRPELADSGSVPYGWLAKYTALVWLASWLIIAIHTWVSIRWSGFAVALGVGGGAVAALLGCLEFVRRDVA